MQIALSTAVRLTLIFLLSFGLVACMETYEMQEGANLQEPEKEQTSDTVAASDEEFQALSARVEARPPVSLGDQDRTVKERLRDATLSTRVEHALAERRTLRNYDFDTEVVRGVLVLEGRVETEVEKQLAERIAGEVEGIAEVVSHIIISEPTHGHSSGSTSGQSSRAAHHVVQPGESLWQIARSHNVRVESIKELNGMTSNSIQPGQRLRVR